MSERHTLTPELIGILGVGIALAGLMTAIWSDLRTDVRTLRADNSRVETELRDNMQEGDSALRDVLLDAVGVVRSDLNGIGENQRAVETRLTVIETTLGFIIDELQSDSDPAADSPQ